MPRLQDIDQWFETERKRFTGWSTFLAATGIFGTFSYWALLPGLRGGRLNDLFLDRVLLIALLLTGAWVILAVVGRFLWDRGLTVQRIVVWAEILSIVLAGLLVIQWTGSAYTSFLLLIPATVTALGAFFGLKRAFIAWLLFSLGHLVMVALEVLGLITFAPLYPELGQTFFGTPLALFCGAFIVLCTSTAFMTLSLWITDALERSRRRTEGSLSALQLTHRDLVVAESQAQVGKLLEKAAGDLNRPLANVLSLTESALEDVTQGNLDASDLKETLTRVREAALAARKSLEEMGKLGSQDVRHMETVDLNLLAQEIGEQAKSPGVGLGIEVLLSLDLDLPPVWANARQVRTAAAALCANALEAYEGRPGNLYLETSLKDGKAEFLVRDEGKGMGPEELSQLFEPLFTTKDHTGHAGLGLYQARHLLELYGGTLEIESAIGRGTTARIVLPLHPDH